MPQNNLTNPRFSAVAEAGRRSPIPAPAPTANGRPQSVTEYFGKNTFNTQRMREKLPRTVFEKLLETVDNGKNLDPEIADAVAAAVREWASESGATHFCHWFQPQTGTTAEKHDAFLTFDKNKNVVEKLTGSQLIQSEPDASSFPSGGVRTTFEARGYTAWDPSSPIFIMESNGTKTLCIPSVFISYHGDALDKKTALLRSIEILSQKSCDLLHLIGESKVRRVVPSLGTEQEYFLIDRAFYALRQDLVMAGRTLLGRKPSKGQQLEDHYFGSIPQRVLSFMGELEYELYKLGVPVKTRHNEVAPSQFELAPIFEEANVAIDHNQIVMQLLKKVARKHEFELLLHEKPFAGINGSGKHCNWSLMIASSGAEVDGSNLLEPGKTPYQNLRFLLFLVATLKGVHKHAGLLRAGIASPANDHRLGANEAPPAIISVFLGDLLSHILDQVEAGTSQSSSTEEAVLKLGVSKLPLVMKDNTDRNRTSPFAFTGNKFEFRAVGSSMSPAFPVTLLNAAVADGIEAVTGALKLKLQSEKDLETAILSVIRDAVKETKSIRFEGNGYSDEWVKEAAKRGLPNLRKTPEALEELVSDKSREMLTRLGVFTESELKSRHHVQVERYVKILLIEAETLHSMVTSQVIPAVLSYHGELLSAACDAKAAGVRQVPQTRSIDAIGERAEKLQVLTEELGKHIDALSMQEDFTLAAKKLSSVVNPKMEEIRAVVDDLEAWVPDAEWPLPKYWEMLFLS